MLAEAVSLASNYRNNAVEGWKNKGSVTKAANFAQGKDNTKKKGKGLECYYCHEKGHIATFCCKKKRESDLSMNC